MLVATFGPATGWHGRQIIWDVDHFILVGHGAIPAAGVLDYDRLGQLVWTRPELRAWVAEVGRWETGGRASPAYGAAAGGAVQAYGPAGGVRTSGRLPAWAIVLIVLGVVAVVGGVIMAALIPSFVMHTTQTLTNDAVVRSGVRDIQAGVESYAAAHSGHFPAPGDVNALGLSRYVPAWPQNPYTDLPMSDGGGLGNFRYDRSPDGGAYKLIGYGRGGGAVIELSGGTDTSV
jgi:hypothetical protein